MILFKDRIDAGKKLAQALQQYKNQNDVMVIGLPRGGVPVAYEVAQELNLPLDIIVTRKIGAPGNQELAVGALTEEGVPLFNKALLETMALKEEDLAATIAKEK